MPVRSSSITCHTHTHTHTHLLRYDTIEGLQRECLMPAQCQPDAATCLSANNLRISCEKVNSHRETERQRERERERRGGGIETKHLTCVNLTRLARDVALLPVVMRS